MQNKLIQYFKDKKIIILGFGREGKSTYNFIRKYLPEQEITIGDQSEDFDHSIIENDKNVSIIAGPNYLDNLEDFDIIMKAPGVSFKDIDVTPFKNKIMSQMELLLEFVDIHTIGITGSKGKSTTCSLMYHVLLDQGKDALLLGNIGVPIFDYIDNFTPETYLVLEMSSHQLEFMNASPNIAAVLNIFEEHLDHYKSFENYANAKANIFMSQKKDDVFFYNGDIDLVKELAKKSPSKGLKVCFTTEDSNAALYIKGDDIFYNDKKIYSRQNKRNLLGDYSLNNIMFVLGISEYLGLDLDKTIKTISEFNGLRHRLQFVGKVDGVSYFDNSIATIPEATIEAVKALDNKVDTLIIGGMDRGIDYSKFDTYLVESNIKNIICMPKTGHDTAKKLPVDKKYVVDTLEDAVKVAKRVTPKGGICLLSPAAASYGFFKNFEEKGDIYQDLVLNG